MNNFCSCAKLSTVENYVLVVQEFFIGCTLSLRVCAMYGFNRRVFISLSIAAITTVAFGAWAIVGPKIFLETSVPGCHTVTPHDQQAQLVCDILILGITLRRAYTYHNHLGLRSPSLLRTMFRDGDIITAGSLAWFACSISATMISRLMLNLHDASNRQIDFQPLSVELEPIRFRDGDRL
ncbi:hypothetical protein B0H14DRAFT_2957998 [Mycena olivaceomarginata]|nr:hypothetical protein B0H14DRAFT_2957998 [Mycena olivaceomarginata]